MSLPARPAFDPLWLAHRYDDDHDALHFLRVEREEHRNIPFLTDEYLPARATLRQARQAALAEAAPPAPLHFIFHSAFCCSTLLLRALDVPGHAMGLSEPVLLNDMVGWRHRRRPDGRQVAALLNQSLTLLARPFGPGEAVVIKPSNLVNPLAAAMLALQPSGHALLLHAPLEAFLGSVARKAMWGRIWVRDLLVKYLREAGVMDFGLSTEEILKLTDIQVAALGWLAQHRIFHDLATRFPERIRTLDSDRLMSEPGAVIEAVSRHMSLGLAQERIGAIVQGPAFTRHSKSGGAFDANARQQEREQGLALHAAEISMVCQWADEVAKGAGIGLQLPRALLQPERSAAC